MHEQRTLASAMAVIQAAHHGAAVFEVTLEFAGVRLAYSDFERGLSFPGRLPRTVAPVTGM
jgi:hypothetical protein